MTIEFYVLLSVLLIGFSVIVLLMFRNKQSATESDAITRWLHSMQETVGDSNQRVNDALRDTTVDVTSALRNQSRELSQRLEIATKAISELNKQVGSFSEIGRGIRSLQDYLQSPKIRGSLGETVMSDMLGQTFAKEEYALQYSFPTGVKVDAVIKTDAGLLPVDAKFPLEKYAQILRSEDSNQMNSLRKDFIVQIKRHMGDISSKYILPTYGTVDFSLMYIPSEAIYYEIVTSEELMTYSRQARVYPVSPNTFYAHLQVLLLSFQGKEMEKQTQQILRILQAVSKEHALLMDELSVLGKHVNNAYNSVNSVRQTAVMVGNKLSETRMLR